MEPDVQTFARIKRDLMYGHDIEPPTVDPERCNGCGLCARVCSGLVFEIVEKKAKVTRGVQCFACGHCWAVCPEDAVSQPEVVTDASLRPGHDPAISPEDLLLLIRERRSTRLFRDTPLEKEQLLKITQAGRYGPTASNRQDVNFVIVSERDRIAELRRLVERFLERTFDAVRNPALAPLLRLRLGGTAVDQLLYYSAVYQVNQARKNEKNAYFVLPFAPALVVAHAKSFDTTAQFGCAIALYNCALMAHSMGLGSCFLGFVQLAASMDNDVKRWLGIPDENQTHGAMLLGQPAIRYRRLIERRQPEITWL